MSHYESDLSKKNNLDTKVDTNRHTVRNIAISIIPALVTIILSVITVPNYAATNDDRVISEILSGFFSGKPDYHTVYTGVIYSAFVAKLYTFFPAIDWWTVLHIAVLFTSQCIINYCIQRVSGNRASNSLVQIVSLLLVGVVFYNISASINLSTTAAAAGSAAVAILFSRALKHDCIPVGEIILAVIFLWISFSYRDASFFICFALTCAVCVFACLTLLKKKSVFKVDWPGKRRTIAISEAGFSAFRYITTVLLVIVMYGVNAFAYTAIYSTSSWRSFSDFNHARAVYLDYNRVFYDQDPELFDSLSITPTHAYLINYWCMTDDVVNQETYEMLSKSVDSNEDVHLESSLKAAIEGNPFSTALFSTSVIAFLLISFHCIRTREDGLIGIFCLGLIIAAGIGLIYLCAVNRVVLRGLLALALPIMILFLIALGRVFINTNKAFQISLSIVMIVLTLITFLKGYETLIDPNNLSYMKYKTARYEEVLSYGADNQSDVIVIDTSVSIDNRMYVQDRKHGAYNNCISLGGWFINSPFWKDQLRNNGIQDFSLKLFLKDNVYYASVIPNQYSQWYGSYLEKYIQEKYGIQCRFCLIENLGSGVGLYKLTVY